MLGLHIPQPLLVIRLHLREHADARLQLEELAFGLLVGDTRFIGGTHACGHFHFEGFEVGQASLEFGLFVLQACGLLMQPQDYGRGLFRGLSFGFASISGDGRRPEGLDHRCHLPIGERFMAPTRFIKLLVVGVDVGCQGSNVDLGGGAQ